MSEVPPKGKWHPVAQKILDRRGTSAFDCLVRCKLADYAAKKQAALDRAAVTEDSQPSPRTSATGGAGHGSTDSLEPKVENTVARSKEVKDRNTQLEQENKALQAAVDEEMKRREDVEEEKRILSDQVNEEKRLREKEKARREEVEEENKILHNRVKREKRKRKAVKAKMKALRQILEGEENVSYGDSDSTGSGSSNGGDSDSSSAAAFNEHDDEEELRKASRTKEARTKTEEGQ